MAYVIGIGMLFVGIVTVVLAGYLLTRMLIWVGWL